MRTKYGLWWACPMIGKPLRINGSSRGRRTLIVCYYPQSSNCRKKVFDKVQSVDYDEIFSLVSMLKSVRIMLAIAAFLKSSKWMSKLQSLMDFLEEELYVMQPKKGFVDLKGANKVCKLQRSIYGLVQASRSWNLCFDELIKAYGILQTFGEACIYKKVSGITTAFLISICE